MRMSSCRQWPLVDQKADLAATARASCATHSQGQCHVRADDHSPLGVYISGEMIVLMCHLPVEVCKQCLDKTSARVAFSMNP